MPKNNPYFNKPKARIFFMHTVGRLRFEVFQDLLNEPLQAYKNYWTAAYDIAIRKKSKIYKDARESFRLDIIPDFSELPFEGLATKINFVDYLTQQLRIKKSAYKEDKVNDLSRLYTEAINSWQNRWNLTPSWCASFAQNEIRYYITDPERYGPNCFDREPSVGPILDPENNGIIPLSGGMLEIRDMLPLKDEKYNESLKWISEDPMGHMKSLINKAATLLYAGKKAEANKIINEKLRDDFNRYAEEWKKSLITTQQRFNPEHFEWLVKRIVPPTESSTSIAKKIKNNVRSKVEIKNVNIREETSRLAKFIEIKIPLKGRGRKAHK